jgi:hypothetical protein
MRNRHHSHTEAPTSRSLRHRISQGTCHQTWRKAAFTKKLPRNLLTTAQQFQNEMRKALALQWPLGYARRDSDTQPTDP